MSKERAVVRTPSIRRVAVRIGIYALVAVWGVVLLIQHLILRPETMDFLQVAFACFFVLAGAIQLRAITGSIRGVQYTFTDQRLILEQHGEKESIELESILDTRLIRPIPERWFGVGDLMIITDEHSYLLLGQEKPEQLQSIIKKASDVARILAQEQSKARFSRGDAEAFSPGSLDKLDTLTGLWQQGLISEEDYERERRHFQDGTG